MITQENIPYTADEIKAMVKTCETYNKALERAKIELQTCGSQDCEAARQIFRLFPELKESKKESKGERIRRVIIEFLQAQNVLYDRINVEFTMKEAIAWLEKQKPIDEEELKKDALKYVACQFMKWLDASIPADEMCLSNAECKVIEDAFLKDDWARISHYMQEKLEKQGEQKPTEDAKTLDADKEIACLKANIIDFEYYVRRFKKDFGI